MLFLRILIYGLNYAPELTGIGKYTGDMARWLSERGHEVRVVTAPPYYPEWKIRADYQGKAYCTERKTGLPTVFRTPLYVPEKPSGIRRIIHLASFMLGSLPVMLGQMSFKPDVVFTIEPTFFCAPVALLVALANGAASWLHVQDFEVDAAFELGLLPAQGWVHGFALWLERTFMREFDCVSSISAKMVERTLTKGIDEEHAVLFPNWVDISHIYPLDGPNSFRQQLGLEGKIVLLYSGNMGNKQGLELLAPLAAAFAPDGLHADARVHLLFCGDGAFRPQLESLVGHLPNVTMLPLQPFVRLNELLNAADIHLLPQRAGAADLVMPSKLTGMLASGKAIVATADLGTQVAHVIDGGGELPTGYVVPAEDAEALHQAVAELVQDPDLRSMLGTNARNYAVKNLGREQVLKQFERNLQHVVHGSPLDGQVN